MIKITDKAKEKLIAVMDEDTVPLIRFGLKGGGCGGFEYFLIGEDTKADDDIEYQIDDTHLLVVDFASSMYLNEAEIDYKKDMMGESFTFLNPQVTTTCGCKSSVSFD